GRRLPAAVHLFEHAAVLDRDDLDEAPQRLLPAAEQLGGLLAARAGVVLTEQPRDERGVVGAERLELDHPEIAALLEQPVLVVDVGEPAAHPGGEVAARAADDDHAPARHVLAAVVPDTLDDRDRAAVADREPLPAHAVEVGVAA